MKTSFEEDMFYICTQFRFLYVFRSTYLYAYSTIMQSNRTCFGHQSYVFWF